MTELKMKNLGAGDEILVSVVRFHAFSKIRFVPKSCAANAQHF